MKQLIIKKSNLNGNINTISSKSLSHRYVIAASLADGISTINNVLNSVDLNATTNILINLGANIKISKDSNTNGRTYIIEKSSLSNPSDTLLDAKESGSTLRFMIPISWALPNTATFTGSYTLGSRPLSVYEEIARSFNLTLSKTNNNFPIEVKGPLTSGTYYVDGSISSQFITGLLFALPLLNNDSKIIFKTALSSVGYVDLTLDALALSGIEINSIDNGYHIKGNQKYRPFNTTVEGDYSQAAFLIVASIITKSNISISNLNLDSKQGDKEILKIINQFGVNYTFENNTISNIFYDKLNDTTIDLKDIPDLGPILMSLAATTTTKTTFLNIDRLYTKESNRLEAMINNLNKINISYNINNNVLEIIGRDNIDNKGIIFDTYNDHRIAMALSVLALNMENDVIINDYEVINKSYPNFYDDLINLGGKIKYVK